MTIHPDILFIALAAADGVAMELTDKPCTGHNRTRATVIAAIEHLADVGLLTLATDEQIAARYNRKSADGFPDGIPLNYARQKEVAEEAVAASLRVMRTS